MTNHDMSVYEKSITDKDKVTVTDGAARKALNID